MFMASSFPVSALLAQAAQPSGLGASLPLPAPAAPAPAAVSAFQSAMSAPNATGMAEELFGTSASANRPVAQVEAPLLELPHNLDYLKGTTKVLETILPTLPNQLPSPMALLSAQLSISAAQLEWQFIAKATGTAVQGIQSLVNSQV